MPYQYLPQKRKLKKKSFKKFYRPAKSILARVPLLCSKGDRPLQMTFEDQFKALLFLRLEEQERVATCCKYLKKIALPVITLPRSAALKRAPFSMP